MSLADQNYNKSLLKSYLVSYKDPNDIVSNVCTLNMIMFGEYCYSCPYAFSPNLKHSINGCYRVPINWVV